MAMEAFALIGKISLDGAERVTKDLKNVGNQADRTGDQTQKSGKKMSDMAQAVGGAFGVVFGQQVAQGLINFTKGVLSVTGELEAIQAQYEQVMGGMKTTSDKYINDMASRWNKHPNELKSTLMQYYAILKGKGLSEKDAYETAQKYMDLTVDGNAFANEDMASTTARFMGMIKGEYDSADTAMVNMSQTMLNEIATKEYGKKWEQLSTTQQETLKTQEAIRQQTMAGVVGQGIRESESYANNVAMLKNNWKEFQAVIGAPIMATVGGLLKDMSTSLKGISDWFKNLSPQTQKYVVLIGGLSIGLTALVAIIGGAVIGFTALASAIGVSVGALALATGGIILIIPVIVGLAVAIVKNWDKIKEKTVKVWNSIKDILVKFGQWMLKYTPLGKFISVIINNWNTIKKTFQIGKDMIVAVLNAIKNHIAKQDWFKSLLEKARKFKESFTNTLNATKDSVSRAVSKMKEILQRLIIKIPKPKLPKITVTKATKKFLGQDIPYPKFNVQWAQRGMYFDKPTLFGIGENKREVVMPIEHRKNMQPFAKAVAENLQNMLQGIGYGQGTIEIPLTINGREFTRAVIANIDQELAKRSKFSNGLLNRGNL